MSGLTEHTVNDALARILRGTRESWRDPSVVQSETTGQIAGGNTRPDIIVDDWSSSPVVIETEVLPAATVEIEAISRLGLTVKNSGKQIQAAVAVRLPPELRSANPDDLISAIESTTIEYALYTGSSPEDAQRWPARGWITGDIRGLSLVVQSGSLPPAVIEKATTRLQASISAAAAQLDRTSNRFPSATGHIARHLAQEPGQQTLRMAAAILTDALIFQESLAGRSVELEDLRNLSQLESEQRLNKQGILEEWRKVLAVNYWPVFDIARRILEAVPSEESGPLVTELAGVAQELVADRLMRTHDLTGTAFQKLISDRKFLAAYYTTPASAALMAGLLLPRNEDLPTGPWSDAASLARLRVADLACGTGTLLSLIYDRLLRTHELYGGSSAQLHSTSMESVLYGCDILPAATHLTASMLAGAYPEQVYTSSNIYTLPYGLQPDDSIALGSVDLLDSGYRAYSMSITGRRLDAQGEEDAAAAVDIPDGYFQLVAMNPPFTRATGQEASKIGVPNPMFAAFGSTSEEQKRMSAAFDRMKKGTAYHGNAGLASLFVSLAHRKLQDGGRLGLILPLSFITGDAWEKARGQIQHNYDELVILSIIGVDGGEISFSADTGMGEVMVVGRKANTPSTSGYFVSLQTDPKSATTAAQTAEAIRGLVASGAVPSLEDGPVGGARVAVGDDTAAHVIRGPLATGGWQLSRVADFSLAQSAHQLRRAGRVWLPGVREADSFSVKLMDAVDVGEIGPYHSAIQTGGLRGARGPFVIQDIDEGVVATYPSLWRHEAPRERTIAFDAWQHGTPKPATSDFEKAAIRAEMESVWETASHLHFNQNFQFNSQSTAWQFTPRLTLGGRAWISLKLQSTAAEMLIALWGNTSVGLLLHWFLANKQQLGRGNVTKSALARFPILDPAPLLPHRSKEIEAVFAEVSSIPLRPIHEMGIDDGRAALDVRVLRDFLGMPAQWFDEGGPLQLLRQKLAAEPSIHG